MLFVLNLPVKKKSQSTAQQNDRTENSQFIPVTGKNSTQHLAAKLELQRKRRALRKIKVTVSGDCVVCCRPSGVWQVGCRV